MNAKMLSFSHRLGLPIAASTIVLVAGLAVAMEPQPEGPVTTTFTHQGRLATEGGEPVNDICDSQFTLWDDLDPVHTNDVVYYQSSATCPHDTGRCLASLYKGGRVS